MLDALRGRHQCKASVAYYLLLDARRRSADGGGGSGAYLRAELSSACEALMQNPLGERKAHPGSECRDCRMRSRTSGTFTAPLPCTHVC